MGTKMKLRSMILLSTFALACSMAGRLEQTRAPDTPAAVGPQPSVQPKSPTAAPLPSSAPIQPPANADTPTAAASPTPLASASEQGIWRFYTLSTSTSVDQAPGKENPPREGYKYAIVEIAVENASDTFSWFDQSLLQGKLFDTSGNQRVVYPGPAPYSWGSASPILIPPSLPTSPTTTAAAARSLAAAAGRDGRGGIACIGCR